MTDTDALKSAISACDVVVNLAGVTHHSANDLNGVNANMARHLLDHADGRPVFLISSAAIYGKAPGSLTETADPTPASDYGRDKADMEAVALAHSARSIILRLGNVAGADALLGVERERYVLDKFPDGSYPARSYIGPTMLADILADLIIAQDRLPDVLNVSMPGAVSMADLLHAAGKPFDDKPAGPGAIAKVELDTAMLETIVKVPAPSNPAQAIVQDWQSVRNAL
jgi:nucleoside-diphosphate-sugar epimerase